ncbi:lytic transglycosylase domain-containing protein [Citreimonas salinaria]
MFSQAALILLGGVVPAWGDSPCYDLAPRAADEAGVPPEILKAIVSAESGGHPWTTNTEGKGAYHSSKGAALVHVRGEQSHGTESIDIGCAQINLRWHPNAFPSLQAGFDPEENLAYAAGFLADLRRQHSSWRSAVGAYHSPGNPARARAYADGVYSLMSHGTQDYERPALTIAAPRPAATTEHKRPGITRTSMLPGSIGNLGSRERRNADETW